MADGGWNAAGTLEGKGCVDCAGSDSDGGGVTAVTVVLLDVVDCDEVAEDGDAVAAAESAALLEALLAAVAVLTLEDAAAGAPGTPAATGSL